ncbi:retrovirus-related Pol polyprotein from type-1 retrotransposable element R2 [Trichonephila clavipes]|nr:retrovirus-related Pol polyprotein from type-1 retrotransposable element R2 [Trichonephila clavipes]
MVGDFATSSNALSNTWTQARKASVRQQVTWAFKDNIPSLSFGSTVITATYRNSVMKRFHEHFRAAETVKLLAQPSQGKSMECVSLVPESGHFITGGLYTRFADWRFVHKARLNLTPLKGSKPWISGRQAKCRKCGKWDETLPHVLNHCKAYSAAWQMRHNNIVRRIKTAVAYNGTILSENQAVRPTSLRPDLVATVGNTLYIIDVIIPFENGKNSFVAAAQRKIEKYSPLIPIFNEMGYESIQIIPIIVGALGAWDPANDRFLRKVATKSYLKTLKKLCVSDTIRWSRDIYIQHLTGKQQYNDSDTPVTGTASSPPPSQGTPSPSQGVSHPEGSHPV